VLCGEEHFSALLERLLPSARVSLWIATANLKELRLPAPVGTRARAHGGSVSVLEGLQSLADRGVELRILHGREPTGPFSEQLAKLPRLRQALKLRLCPRNHMKLWLLDGTWAYLGSANFTGAGLGARSPKRRNFEVGVLTDDDWMLDKLQAHFDDVWSGRHCGGCGLRAECPCPLDDLQRGRPRVAPAAAEPQTRGHGRRGAQATKPATARSRAGRGATTKTRASAQAPSEPASSAAEPKKRTKARSPRTPKGDR